MKTNIPKFITVDNKKYNLSKTGTKSEIEKHKQNLIDFNADQRKTAGKSWRNVYKYRVKKYGKIYAIFTN
jgi:hypothetical protein